MLMIQDSGMSRKKRNSNSDSERRRSREGEEWSIGRAYLDGIERFSAIGEVVNRGGFTLGHAPIPVEYPALTSPLQLPTWNQKTLNVNHFSSTTYLVDLGFLLDCALIRLNALFQSERAHIFRIISLIPHKGHPHTHCTAVSVRRSLPFSQLSNHPLPFHLNQNHGNSTLLSLIPFSLSISLTDSFSQSSCLSSRSSRYFSLPLCCSLLILSEMKTLVFASHFNRFTTGIYIYIYIYIICTSSSNRIYVINNKLTQNSKQTHQRTPMNHIQQVLTVVTPVEAKVRQFTNWSDSGVPADTEDPPLQSAWLRPMQSLVKSGGKVVGNRA
ncbi:hypothetical protein VP01_5336g1 [Puccinia sorghi]|uniref:Uncharacterized protein n=1 Tax=Puccinia sorghi TaxID=27349 RepID=A0A0L6UKX2_9BASI|nr:hypothetical protein VP01_5336g1 [Puccinia sorghi]